MLGAIDKKKMLGPNVICFLTAQFKYNWALWPKSKKDNRLSQGKIRIAWLLGLCYPGLEHQVTNPKQA